MAVNLYSGVPGSGKSLLATYQIIEWLRSGKNVIAKQRIYDIAMCNEFTWFITWTLSSKMINRYDSQEVSKRLKYFLNNKVKRNDARYLVIPEHHKDGAIHMHGLLSGQFEMADSGHRLPDGRPVFNMPQWTLGFSTAIALDAHKDYVSAYITKYVTKEFKKIFGSFYYAGGHGLVRSPEISLCDTDYDAVLTREYKPDAANVWFKYLRVEG